MRLAALGLVLCSSLSFAAFPATGASTYPGNLCTSVPCKLWFPRATDRVTYLGTELEACRYVASWYSGAYGVATSVLTPVPGSDSSCAWDHDFGSWKLHQAVPIGWSWGSVSCPASSTFTGHGECACDAGFTENATRDGCVAKPPSFTTLSISGASQTRALIAGPVLPQTVHVVRDGQPASGVAVAVRLPSGTTLSGTTDGAGDFVFTYVPPYEAAVETITATCTGCSNTAAKQVTVEAADVCEGKLGNPISTATGEKLQVEPDWEDASPHPLSFTRFYGSRSKADVGLGPRWSHSFNATLTVQPLDATVRLGDDSKVIFSRRSATDPWRADNGVDALVEAGGVTTYTRGDAARWVFDGAGRITTLTERNGRAMRFTYGASGRLDTVTNAFGRALRFTYDAAGRLFTVTTPDAQRRSYLYDPSGRLTAVVYPDGTRRTYAYADARWPTALTGITDENGVAFASFTYDAMGRATSTRHAGDAQPYVVDYGAAPASTGGGLVAGSGVDAGTWRSTSKVTDPLRAVRTLSWQGGDGTVRMLGTDGAFDGQQVASRTFVPGTSLPADETDFVGTKTTFEWDTARRLPLATTLAANQPQAQTTRTQWDTALRLPMLVTEPGRRTAYVYDAAGNVLRETVTDTATGEARATSWTYDALGQVLTSTDARGAMTSFGYDPAGNLGVVRDALGRETRFTYDGAGRALTKRDPDGVLSTFAYDARGRPVRVSQGSDTTTLAYTPSGQLRSVTLPNRYAVNYGYDAAQRLTFAADNRANVARFTLDAMGNRVRDELIDPSGAWVSTMRSFSALNLLQSVASSSGATNRFGFDGNGSLVSATDALGRSTRRTLDPLGRPIMTALTDGSPVRLDFNALDELTAARDPKGAATQLVRNAFGEVLMSSSADTGTTRYLRDTAGNVVARTDAKGLTTRYALDPLGRTTRITFADGRVRDVLYDVAGRLLRVMDASGSTTWQRDTFGRVLFKQQTVGSPAVAASAHAVRYAYLPGGELAQLIYPSGMQVLYRRDPTGQLKGVDVQQAGQAPVPLFGNLTYGPAGQLKGGRWFNGEVAMRAFDADGRVSSTELGSYGRDAEGRITTVTQRLRAKPGSGVLDVPLTWRIGYDVRGRLVTFERDGSSAEYGYDANGNRMIATEKWASGVDLDPSFGAELSRFSYQTYSVAPNGNRLLAITSVRGGQGLQGPLEVAMRTDAQAFDANGNVTSDGQRFYEYDVANRLVAARSSAGLVASYRYNGLGQRVFKGDAASMTAPPPPAMAGTSYVYDDVGANLLGTYRGTETVEYVWLPTDDGQRIPIGVVSGGRLFAVHADHLGTPRLVTDAQQQPVWQWPFSAFGATPPTGPLAVMVGSPAPQQFEATPPLLGFDLRFPGQVFDVETGLFQNWNRDYDPRLGRYIEADPIGLEGGLNPYVYVDSDPLGAVDPDGLQKLIGQKHLDNQLLGFGGGGGGALPSPFAISGGLSAPRGLVMGSSRQPSYSPTTGPSNINRTGCMTNCAQACIATELTARGRPMWVADAPPSSTLKAMQTMERLFGGKFGRPMSQEELTTTLLQAGPGARMLIHGNREFKMLGHWFNGQNAGGKALFWDGQIGGAAKFEFYKPYGFEALVIAP